MKLRNITTALALLVSIITWGDVPSRLEQTPTGDICLMVNNQPYLMVAGEFHDSSALLNYYPNTWWTTVKSLNLNTVLAPVPWQLIEPNEGEFDFKKVDNLINGARKNGLNVVILWYGSWKNGESTYVPAWVKRDTNRFVRVRDVNDMPVDVLSPFYDSNCEADAKAYAALLQHIKEIDNETGTVIAIQTENEVGIFKQDMDYSEAAKEAFKQQVPHELIAYMTENYATLHSRLKRAWESHGKKNAGTWTEVLGDDMYAKNFFLAWAYGKYVDKVAGAGKQIYPIPTFCNAWIVQHDKEIPGDYPNGGPVAHVMDIWKAAAPNIDIISPDIYLPKFKSITAEYKRHDNPLLIPEATLNPANAFWAFGEHGALCYSPYDIANGASSHELGQSYLTLRELIPVITKYTGGSRMFGVMNDWDDDTDTGREIKIGNYIVNVEYDGPKAFAYGLIIQMSEDDFLVVGVNFKVKFSAAPTTGKTCEILQISEGGFNDNGEWTPMRVLSGEETLQNTVLKAKGREKFISEIDETIYTPAIYRITTSLTETHIPADMWIGGPAVGGAWGAGKGKLMIKESEAPIYTITTYLDDSSSESWKNQFKFFSSQTDERWEYGPVDGQAAWISDACNAPIPIEGVHNTDHSHFFVNQKGTYNLAVNLENHTLSAKYCPDALYAIGCVTGEYNWDADKSFKLTKSATDPFVFNGELNLSNAVADQIIFRFITSNVSDQCLQIGPSEESEIVSDKECPFKLQWGDPGCFVIKQANYGTYNVTVDFKNQIFTAVEKNSSGIESISNDDNATVTVYSIDGRAVMVNAPKDALNTLSRGIYIVNGRKIAITR